MKRYSICIDLPDTVKHIPRYLENKIKGSQVIVYFEIRLKKIYPQKVKEYKEELL